MLVTKDVEVTLLIFFFSSLQEPGANATEIYAVIKHVRPGNGMVPKFKMFAKTEVNGENESPIYTFLKSRCPATQKKFSLPEKLNYKPFHQDDIR